VHGVELPRRAGNVYRVVTDEIMHGRQDKANGIGYGLFLLEKAFIGKQTALLRDQRQRIAPTCKISPDIACILRREHSR
jgi:hypothetical protein